MYRAKILVADDDPEWRELVSHWLSREGYRLFFADKAEAVAPLAVARRPDCIVLDYQLGPRDAAEVCRQLKADPALKATPVVILTSHADLELKAYRELEADQFVEKDSKAGKLVAVLEAVLRRRAWDAGRLRKGDLELEPASFGVYREGRLVAHVSREQFLLLQLLVQRSPQFVPPSEIYKHVLHQHRALEETDAIRSLAHRTRKALDATLARRIRSAKRLGWAYLDVPSAKK